MQEKRQLSYALQDAQEDNVNLGKQNCKYYILLFFRR